LRRYNMARASVQGNIVVAGPDGVMALSRWANATLWNACGLCAADCHALCGRAWPGGCCPPRHGARFNLNDEGLKCG